jgi:anti-sigma regulatory factor (Ser/Thr protein kinase)
VVTLSGWLAAPAPSDMRWLRVEEASAAAGARSAAVALARQVAFPDSRIDELSLAVTEAATNLYKHASEGALLLRICRDAETAGIELVTIDAGPGINDVGAALQDGHSTTATLGIGLGAIRRIADSCDMYSRNRGTALVARFWQQKQPYRPSAGDCAGLIRPIAGEIECGDSYGVARVGAVLTGIVCDGLGHGPLAAAASREAVSVLRETPADEPAVLLERVHRRMAGTRGGAVAIVRIEGQTVRFAGLGNIAAWIVGHDTRQGMISVPGIAGHQARRFRQFEFTLPPGAVVILHSDGLSSRWDIRQLPGLTARDPLAIAAALLGEAGVHRDDTGVLVLKP